MAVAGVVLLPQGATAQTAAAQGLACLQLVEALAQGGRVALQGVEFDFNRATLRPDSLPALIAARDAMLSLGGDWRIEGHTDNRGSHAYNQALSEARALAVRDWMVAAGVPGEQLAAAGFSFDRPVADNITDAGRAQNRRVELVGTVAPDALGFGGPAGADPCPATLTPGTLGSGTQAAGSLTPAAGAGTAAADAVPPPPPISEWTGTGGQEWLPFSLLMTTGYGSGSSWEGQRLSMPPGTQPQACQALCSAQTQCAAFSFEPAGSDFVDDARCALIGYGTEVSLVRSNAYLDGGTHYASGVKADAQILTPESEEIARQILADLAEMARLRQTVRITAPDSRPPESWMDVAVDGAVPGDRYNSFIEITELDDYAFDWRKSRSALFVHQMADGRSGQIWVPEPGEYVLRYAIDHPTAGLHVIAEQAFSVHAGAPLSGGGGDGAAAASPAAPSTAQQPDGASVNFPMVLQPGEDFTVSYSGPLNSGDWIDIITLGNDEDMSGGWGWGWATGTPVPLAAPATEGEYRLRYVAEDPQRGRVVLVSEPLIVRAQAPATAAPSQVFHRCEGAAGSTCELMLPEHDVAMTLLTGYGITEPMVYVTAGGVAAARPGFDVVRLGDGVVVVTVNARQADWVYCQDGPAGDQICVPAGLAEVDGLAAAMAMGTLTSTGMTPQAQTQAQTQVQTQAQTQPAAKDEPAAAPGDLQGVWWASVDMPGTADDQSHFIVIELIQDAGDVALQGSFVTAPDIGPLRGISGDVAGAIGGDTLNLTMAAPDGVTGLVFTGTEYGGDAWRGQIYLAHMPVAPPTGAILRRIAGPGEEWSGAPWMTGQADGMAAALQMGQQALQGALGDLSGQDRDMAQMMARAMGAMSAGTGTQGGGQSPSAQMQALGGVALGDLSAEEALILLAPHLEE